MPQDIEGRPSVIGGTDILKAGSVAEGRRNVGRPAEGARMSEDSAIGKA